MTVAIVLQVHDGVVLASDSALTLTDPSKVGPESVLNVYNNGNKIFNLHKDLPVGAVFFGAGSLGQSSISTLVKDLRSRFSGADEKFREWTLNKDNYTIKEVAEKTREFLFDETFVSLKITGAVGTQFGFIVAGYSSGAQLSEVWTFEIINGKCEEPRNIMPQGSANAYAGGDPEVFARLALGASNNLGTALKAIGVPDDQIQEKISIILPILGTPLVEAPMPIQDAIDLAEFIVNTTATFTRFKRGAGTVGGPTESAAITKHEGFKWIHRKHYFDMSLNPTGSK
jgi:hypothetical protein